MASQEQQSHLVDYVMNGLSFQKQSVEDKDYAVWKGAFCTFEIRNHHRYLNLVSPQYLTWAGVNKTPPPAAIQHGTAETFIFKKTNYSGWGSSGLVIYDIQHVDDKMNSSSNPSQIIMMWSVPFRLGSNCHALGISQQLIKHSASKELYFLLRDGHRSFFERCNAGTSLALENYEICGIPVKVFGSMSQTTRAVWTIDFR